MQLVSSKHKFKIPDSVAKCPYCNTKLYVKVNAWTENDDGWVAESIEMVCETEPDIDSEEWKDWEQTHGDMPYVYLLPVQNRVQEWINSNFRFDMSK